MPRAERQPRIRPPEVRIQLDGPAVVLDRLLVLVVVGEVLRMRVGPNRIERCRRERFVGRAKLRRRRRIAKGRASLGGERRHCGQHFGFAGCFGGEDSWRRLLRVVDHLGRVDELRRQHIPGTLLLD